jgi:hypothetical protein
VGKRLDLYKRESRTWEKGHRGTRAKTEQKFRAKKNNNTQREGEKKRVAYTETRISLDIVLVPTEKEQPEIIQKLIENRHTHYLLSSFIS